jgi:AcrR family transcriptional regulator
MRLVHPPRPRGERKRDRAKARLLEAALEIFGNQGLEAATVRQIAQAAGQNIAAIEYYFGGKEALYRAVLERIVAEIRKGLDEVLAGVAAFQAQAEHPADEALRLLKLFLRTVYVRFLSRDDMLPVARLIVREQLKATAGFEVLYEGSFRRIHEALCFLVGTLWSTSPRDTQTILRTHTLMGQIYFFAMSRQALLRRTGWSTLEGGHAGRVADLVAENLDILVAGLASRAPNPRNRPRQ